MTQNVCIIVPVHNVEQILVSRIMNLIDVISELNSDFEIRIVDDCSIDTTFDIAMVLATEFPQIQAKRTSEQIGIAVAAEAEIRNVSASCIFIHDISQAFRLAEFMKLWRDAGSSEEKFIPERIDQVHLQHGLQMIKSPRLRSPSQISMETKVDPVDVLSRLKKILRNRANALNRVTNSTASIVGPQVGFQNTFEARHLLIEPTATIGGANVDTLPPLVSK